MDLNAVGTMFGACVEKLSPFEAGFFRGGKVIEPGEQLSHTSSAAMY